MFVAFIDCFPYLFTILGILYVIIVSDSEQASADVCGL